MGSIRATLVILLLLAAPAAATDVAAPQAPAGPTAAVTVSDGITVLGTPRLPADFPYFPYVNPNAPKGGTVTLAATGSYDSFNPFILRGTAAWGLVGPWVAMPGGTGSGASVGHVWESLLTPSADEIATGYCHICTRVEMPADRSWVAFTLHPVPASPTAIP